MASPGRSGAMDFAFLQAAQPFQHPTQHPQQHPYASADFFAAPSDAFGFPRSTAPPPPPPPPPPPEELDDAGSKSRPRSSSELEDKDTAALTPAQSRRKAQNRAAQRAFRERKERHVRDLEAKLAALESSTHSLQSDNERLKLALQRARTENDILRATSAHSPPPSPDRLVSPSDDDNSSNYNVQSLAHASVVNSAGKLHSAPYRRAAVKEIPAAQTWDLIQAHPLVRQGSVDVAHVVERLRGTEKCDGNGPVFDETVVRRAIELSRRTGGDELI